MSLVNDMLRDLDARSDSEALERTLGGLDPAPIRRNQPAYAHWLLVPLLLGLAGGAAWLWLTHEDEPPRPAAGMTTPPVTAKPLPPLAGPLVTETPPDPTPPTPKPEVASTPAPAAAPAPLPAVPENAHVRPVQTEPAVIKKARALSPMQQAEQYYAEAMTAFREGNLRLAESRLSDALALAPDHIRAREQLVLVLLMQQRPREAEMQLREALSADPTQSRLAMQLAQLLAGRGQSEAALAVMEPALLDGAANAAFLGTLAGLYQQTGRPQQAIDNYRAALSLRPDMGVWWMGLGISLEQSGDLTAALDAYRRAESAKHLKPSLQKYVEQRLSVLSQVVE